MFTQETLMKYIYDYIKACKELGVTYKKVILFGSYARNQAHKWSDIDLALVSDDFNGGSLADIRKISRALTMFNIIEPHTYNATYFEDGDPFTETIKKTGIEIPLNQNESRK
jgi:predicted nucleotidyltransferase